MGDEYDLYGADIYGGLASNSAARPAQRDSQSLAGYSSGLDHTRGGNQHARITELETQLEEWTSAFQDAASGGLDGKGAVDPRTLLSEMKRLRTSEKGLQAEVVTLKQREQRLQMHLAERNVEAVDLKRQLHTARQTADPNIAQVRQLLLDPAVAREFERLRKEAEAKAKEVKALQEELQAVGFSQESKAGRMLMTKCRALQDENEELGRELAEGKVHSLEQQVALARGFVEDLRTRYLQLEDHTHTLDTEAEDLARQVINLKQQLREASSAASRHARPGPPPPPRFSGKPQHGGPPSSSPGGWEGPQGGSLGRPNSSRHEGPDRKRPYDGDRIDDRSRSRPRSDSMRK